MDEVRASTAIFGLSAFAASVVASAWTGLGAAEALGRAIPAMLVCAIIGAFAGTQLRRVVREHVEGYASSNPVPQVSEVQAIEQPEQGSADNL